MTPTPLAQLLALIPAFAAGVTQVQVLPGGLTNANHRVHTPDGAFVLRCWSDDTGLLAIDRDHEHENSVRAAAAGVGAPVVDYLPEHNAMVFGFVPGRTMSAADLREGDHLPQVADVCRRLHAAARFRGDFDMFAVQQRYLRIVQERGFRLPDGYLSLAPHAAAARAALDVRAEPTVPCHNDLLAENLILHDGTFTLIDYEYSGNNEPSFELGNLAAECHLSPDALHELVAAYYGRPLRHLVARARLWGTIAQYGWTLWASIQDGVSALDFDFRAWGRERYERAAGAFADPGFGRLLDEARRAD